MEDIKAVLTNHACSEPCWYAHDPVCRCICGGKNHGIMHNPNARLPRRMAKINGYMYRLKAVGRFNDLYRVACEINRRNSATTHSRATGFHEWKGYEPGAPARIHNVNKAHSKWVEVVTYKGESADQLAILWVKEGAEDTEAEIQVAKQHDQEG